MTYGFVEFFVDGIQVIKPGIPGNFIASLPPNALLGIQSWLIRWKVSEMDFLVTFKKKLDLFAFMPWGPIHIKPNIIAGKLLPYMLQDFHICCRISMRIPLKSATCFAPNRPPW